jgi:hypothetical protein
VVGVQGNNPIDAQFSEFLHDPGWPIALGNNEPNGDFRLDYRHPDWLARGFWYIGETPSTPRALPVRHGDWVTSAQTKTLRQVSMVVVGDDGCGEVIHEDVRTAGSIR